jgi:hypothetical protein
MEKEFIKKIFEKTFYWCDEDGSNIRTPFIYDGNLYYLEFNNISCVIFGVENNECIEKRLVINQKIKEIYFDKVSKDIMDKEGFFIELDILLRELKIDKILKQI